MVKKLKITKIIQRDKQLLSFENSKIEIKTFFRFLHFHYRQPTIAGLNREAKFVETKHELTSVVKARKMSKDKIYISTKTIYKQTQKEFESKKVN